MPSKQFDHLDHRYIVVADEDPAIVAFVVKTLRAEGHAVFHAFDGLAAVQLCVGLNVVDLLVSNTRVEGMDGFELIADLRKLLPALCVLYLASTGQSSLELESHLPTDVPVLREPFAAEELVSAVRALLNSEN
jgi:DNA-binding response OmpR family regulator